MTKTCPDCGGKGLHFGQNIFDDQMCIRCNGQGKVEQPDEQPDEQSFGNEKLTREELSREEQ